MSNQDYRYRGNGAFMKAGQSKPARIFPFPVMRSFAAFAIAFSRWRRAGTRDMETLIKIVLTINVPFGAAVILMFFWRRLTVAAV